MNHGYRQANRHENKTSLMEVINVPDLMLKIYIFEFQDVSNSIAFQQNITKLTYKRRQKCLFILKMSRGFFLPGDVDIMKQFFYSLP